MGCTAASTSLQAMSMSRCIAAHTLSVTSATAETTLTEAQ